MKPKIIFTDIETTRVKFIDNPQRRVIFEDNVAHVTVDNPNAKK